MTELRQGQRIDAERLLAVRADIDRVLAGLDLAILVDDPLEARALVRRLGILAGLAERATIRPPHAG